MAKRQPPKPGKRFIVKVVPGTVTKADTGEGVDSFLFHNHDKSFEWIARADKQPEFVAKVKEKMGKLRYVFLWASLDGDKDATLCLHELARPQRW